MYIDCYALCGVGNNKCKNKYCSANPNYSAPRPKVKTKGGPGKPCHTTRSKIRKDDGRGYTYWQIEDLTRSE